jgi:hypothetical protein
VVRAGSVNDSCKHTLGCRHGEASCLENPEVIIPANQGSVDGENEMGKGKKGRTIEPEGWRTEGGRGLGVIIREGTLGREGKSQIS